MQRSTPAPSNTLDHRAQALHALPLQDLLDRGGFLPRHIGPDEADLARMLDVIGVDSVEQLLEHTIPESIRETSPLALPPPVPEAEVIERLMARFAASGPASTWTGSTGRKAWRLVHSYRKPGG